MLDHRSDQIENPDVIALRARQLVVFFARHWLGLLLTSMLIFTSVPFLAPVAMAAGWTQAGNAIYSLYSPFCHQLPQRSWFLFGPRLTYTLSELQQYASVNSPWAWRSFVGNPELGWKVAWSDRMVSFYFMVPIFGLVYALLRARGVRVKPISWLILAALLALMAIDGVTHALNDILSAMAGGGFRDTNAWLAALTGNAFPGFYAGDQFGTFNWWARLITGLLAALGLAFFTFPWLDEVIDQEFHPIAVK